MGFNTTMIVMNDALHCIKEDPDFGCKLAEAIIQCAGSGILQGNHLADVPAGSFANAATVIESHHADGTAVVAIGGNIGTNLGIVFPYGDKEEYSVRVLRQLADQLGYQLRKKPRRK